MVRPRRVETIAIPPRRRVKAGMLFESRFDDTLAVWEVERSEGDRQWQCVIVEPLELSDIHKSFHANGILPMVEAYDKKKEEEATEAKWYFSQIGETVHYSHGFGQFVRCLVVNKDGKGALKPKALVGDWKPFDLPRRDENGSLITTRYVEQVRKGEVFLPNWSNVYESPAAQMTAVPVPSELEPISLEIPAMTPAQAEAARWWRVLKEVKALLEQDEHSPRTRLDLARHRIGLAFQADQ